MSISNRKQIYNIDFKPLLRLDAENSVVTEDSTLIGAVTGTIATYTLTTSSDYTAFIFVGDSIIVNDVDSYLVETVNTTTITTTTALVATYASYSLRKFGVVGVTNIGARSDIGISQSSVKLVPLMFENDPDFNSYAAIKFFHAILESNTFNSNFAEINSSWSVTMVLKHITANHNGLAFGCSNYASDLYKRVFHEFATSTSVARSNRSSLITDNNATDNRATDTNTHIVHYAFNGENETLNAWVDGEKVLTNAAQPITSRIDLDRMTFGGWFHDSAVFNLANMKLGFAEVYDFELNSKQVETINNALNPRFDVYTPTEKTVVDLFLIAGQSNAAGAGVSSTSPLVQIGFEIDNTTITKLRDPVGNANTGCAWPSFANARYAGKGRVPMVNAASAVSGSALLAAADGGSGNWSPTGALRASAISNWNAAITTINASNTMQLGNVYVLWHQGEREAQNINGTTVTAALYQAALVELAEYFYVNIAVPFKVMGVFELGRQIDLANESDFAAIRAAQAGAADDSVLLRMISTIQKDFVAEDLMKDNLHYTQPGYDAMGAEGAKNL